MGVTSTTALVFLAFHLFSLCVGRAVIGIDQTGMPAPREWPVLCPPHTYYSVQKEICEVCSSCPINRIITSPCHGFHDTQCGPFYGNKYFLYGESDAGDDDPDSNPSNLTSLPSSVQIAGKATDTKDNILGHRNSQEVKEEFQGQHGVDDSYTDQSSLFNSGSLLFIFTIILSVILSLASSIAVVLFCVRRRSMSELEHKYNPPPENV